MTREYLNGTFERERERERQRVKGNKIFGERLGAGEGWKEVSDNRCEGPCHLTSFHDPPDIKHTLL